VRPNPSLSRAVAAAVLIVSCSCGAPGGCNACCPTPCTFGTRPVNCDLGFGYDAGNFDATTDALSDVPRDRASLDARDSRVAVPRSYCRGDFECPMGLECDLSFMGGLCRGRCTTDRQCPASWVCAGVTGCYPACEPRNDDCAQYYGLCLSVDAADPTRTACFPSCTDRPEPFTEQCVDPRRCDLWASQCSLDPRAGTDNGSSCADAATCRGGHCVRETNADGTPSGFVDGFCYSIARRPPDAAFVPGMPLPRGNCPPGSVAQPDAFGREGYAVACLHECRLDADCRAGYICNRGITTDTPMGRFTTGGCIAFDCSRAGSMCPAGFHCATRASGGTTRGYCERDASGDAGADGAATDAPASDAIAIDVGAIDATE